MSSRRARCHSPHTVTTGWVRSLRNRRRNALHTGLPGMERPRRADGCAVVVPVRSAAREKPQGAVLIEQPKPRGKTEHVSDSPELRRPDVAVARDLAQGLLDGRSDGGVARVVRVPSVDIHHAGVPEQGLPDVQVDGPGSLSFRLDDRYQDGYALRDGVITPRRRNDDEPRLGQASTDAGEDGSNVAAELRGANTHVVAATGDDNDLGAGRNNGADSGSVRRAAGFTRRGVTGAVIADILLDPPLLQAHKVGPALRRHRGAGAGGVGVPQEHRELRPGRGGG